MHWTDACYEAGRVHCVDLEEKIDGALAACQSAHLLKRAQDSPHVMSNPSIKRPTSTQFESYHFTDEDANERKSLISRIGSSQADPPIGKTSPDGGKKEPGSRLDN